MQWIRAPKADFKVVEGHSTIEIEAKFSHAKIFPCWIKRDWITRFSRNCWDKLVVINRGMKLPEKSKALLKQHRIRLIFYDRLTLVLQTILGALKYLKSNHSLNTPLYFERKMSVVCVMFKSLSTRFEQFLRRKRKEENLETSESATRNGVILGLPIHRKEVMQMGMYTCDRCGFTTTEEGEANLHAFEEHDLEIEECFSEEEAIEESLEEIPDETEVIDEEDLLGLARAKVALEDYDELDEREKKTVLSKVLGQSRGSDKVFAEKVTTSNAVPKAYTDLIDKLQDKKLTVCPICGRPYEDLAKEETEKLTEQHKELEGKFPIIRLHHIQTKHVAIWNFIADLFGIPEKKDLPHQQITWTPNPESCSAEEMTKEELSQEKASNPELRAKLFRMWKESKKSRR